MSLKFGKEHLLSPKGEQPSATYDYIISINYERTSAFLESGEFAHGLDIKCSFWGGNQRAFFFSYPIILPQILIM